jgi:hypothetical protein
MKIPISYSHLGSHGSAEYFHFKIDYSDLSEEPSDREIINGAVAKNFGGHVDHELRCVTVYPAETQMDELD